MNHFETLPVYFEKPDVKIDENNEFKGSLEISPLTRGFATTLGNSLRRVLLSSLPGAAAVYVKVSCADKDVLHEFTTLPGVKEDLCEILLNIKGIVVKLCTEEPKTVHLRASGNGEITAGDIHDPHIEIINPEKHIAYLSKGADLSIDLTFDHGIGYASAEQNRKKYANCPLGTIFVDSVFSPAVNVNYRIEGTRVGSSTSYEKLLLDIETNGSIFPKDALVLGAGILSEHFDYITQQAKGYDDEHFSIEVFSAGDTDVGNEFDISIDDMDLSVRSRNCLLRMGIRSVGELTRLSREELKKTRNLGVKSLEEIEEKISEFGLHLKSED